MSLYDILACPICKVRVIRENGFLRCTQCGQTFPIVKGVPVMFPDGSIPEIKHESELVVRRTYDPWVHRVILQSLLDHQIVLEVGSGNMALDDPCIIRMDVQLSPYVDLVGDIHALPLLPESVDYIFSLAVVEHLRNPFVAAQAMYEALKDGGYIYHECNFVFAYHGYPHHYFNASMQGMEQIFSQCVPLRKGIATYQMPSFALDMVLRTYLNYSHAREYPHGRCLTALLEQIVNQDLKEYDIYFSEDEALNVAAGTYFAGMKQTSPDATLIPLVIKNVWERNKYLQERFPNINQLTTIDNTLTWAKREGRNQFLEIAEYLDNIVPYNKRGSAACWDRSEIHSMPLIEPRFSAMAFNPDDPMRVRAQIAESRIQSNLPAINQQLSLIQQGVKVLKSEGPISLIRKLLGYIARSISR